MKHYIPRLFIFTLILSIVVIGCKDSPTGTEEPPEPPETNSAPSASIEASDSPYMTGEQVTLDASNSSDPDNDDLSYSWTLNVPSGSNTDLSETDAMETSFIPDEVGEYTATLTVSDGNGESDDVSVTLAAEAYQCSTTEISSHIDSDQTLKNKCIDPNEIDYRITDAIVVTADLTIDPGVVISFTSNSGIEIRSSGTISAIGKADSSIVFTGDQQSPGFWRNLRVRSNSPINELDHVRVEYGGSSDGNVEVGYYSDESAQLKVSNSTFSHSGTYGIYVEDASQFSSFGNNTFSNNADGPLYLPTTAISALDGASTYADGNGNDDRVEVYARNVTDSMSWPDLEDASYLFTGTPVIENDVVVEPGVQIVFAGDAGITVNSGGTFSAVGTSDKRITFTGEQQAPGYWRSIMIRTNSQQNALDYVDVSYGGSDNGNVEVGYYSDESARLKVSNSTFSHSATYGILVEDDSRFTTFANNTFSQNSTAPLYLPAPAIDALDGNSNYEDGNGSNRVEVYAGTVTQDVVWNDLSDDADGDKDEAAYLFSGDTQVEGALTIEEGATLLFKETASIIMHEGGTMNAVGTSAERIDFAGEARDKTTGYWDGLVFRTNSPDNLLENVAIFNGGSGGYGNVLVGYYNNENARLTIRNSEIGYSSHYGVYVKDSATYTDVGNTYYDNSEGDVHL